MRKFPDFFDLNNGHKIPIKGIGTAGATNFPDIILKGISFGYRLIDTAKLYQTEQPIGMSLKIAFESKLIERKDIFITSKIFNNSEIDPEEEILDSLKKLGIDYLDLVLIHWPNGKVEEKDGKIALKQYPLHILWKKLENCVKKGIVRSLGLSNFNAQLILDLLTYCEIKPVINQIEVHPYCTQENLVKFCQKFEIQVTSYSQFCNGAWKKSNSSGLFFMQY
jgi:diketogulonate reductase-like aldo/keto reductase